MNVVEPIRRVLRRNRYWVRMRRLQFEGPVAALRRWRIWTRILGTARVRTEPAHKGAPAEVHLLCCERDYLCALWALKSFYRFAQVTYPLAVHLQGWCPERAVKRLRHHFPDARVITQAEADAVVEPALHARGLGRLLALRRQSLYMLKFTDFLLTCQAPRLLMLDSDVLFFAHPRHLVQAAQSASEAAVFQRDRVNGYNISAERAFERFGVRLAPLLNAGLAVVPRDAVDLARSEDFLSDGEVARPNASVEQTLYALCVSERLAVEYLPPESYLISLEPCSDLSALIARHYTWLSRPFFTSEGLPALIAAGFLENADAGS